MGSDPHAPSPSRAELKVFWGTGARKTQTWLKSKFEGNPNPSSEVRNGGRGVYGDDSTEDRIGCRSDCVNRDHGKGVRKHRYFFA